MAYRFKRKMDSVQAGVRTIAAELIDDALETTEAKRDLEAAVHNVRKTCKKLRGLVRLVRPVFADYSAENAEFRQAGRRLSVLRDSAVLIQTYDNLLDAFDEQVDRMQFAPVRRRLTLQRQALLRHADVRRTLREAANAMGAARKRARHWRLDADGFDAIEPGLARSYKRARRAMIAASKDTSAEAVHEWRKRIKDHWYHSRLLSPAWPDLIKPHRAAADELGKLLGQHHDLEFFVRRIAEDDLADAGELDVLTALVRRRQQTLADEAFLLGARLLAEPAKHIALRWRSYWHTWQDDDAQAALAA